MKRSKVLRSLPLLLLMLASCSRDPHVQAQRYVDQGNKFFAKSLYKEAAIMYKKALSKDQKFGEAYYRLGLTDLKLGSLGEAVQMLRFAVSPEQNLKDTEVTDAATQLGNIYVFAATQDPQHSPELLEEAQAQVDKLFAKDANSYDGHRLAGQIAILKKDPKTAIQELEKANTLKPNQSEVVMAYYQALIVDKQDAAAEKLARDFITQEKTFGQIYDQLYIHYMISARLKEAEDILKLKVDNNPTVPNYLLQLAAHYAFVKRRPDMEPVMKRLEDEKQFPEGHLLAGDFYFFRLREYELAEQQYQAGMAAFPKQKLDYQKRLVELYASNGSGNKASQLVDTLLKENPKDTDVIAMHAALLLTTGKPDQIKQASVDLQSLVTKNPNNHLLKFNYARALVAEGPTHYEAARLQLEDAIKMRPDFVKAREWLARLYMMKTDAARALQTSDDLLQIDRNNLAGHLTRSAALLALRDYDKARTELDLIGRLYPNDPDARFQVGLLAWQDKDFKRAEQTFGDLYRENHDTRGLMGITETLAAQNRINDAIKEMDKAVAAEPNRADLALGRANLYVRAQRYDEAIASFKTLLQKDPASADLMYRLAETYRRKGDINVAADMFRKTSQAAPTNPAPLVQLGMILETIGPADQAKATYEQILKLDPNNYLALNNLAFRKAEEGQDLDAALQMAQRARQVDPNGTAVADTLGWIYIKKNQSAEAERIFKDLVVKEPANSTFHYHYGLALMQKGDRTSARRELEMALKNKPSKDEAGKIQEELKKL